jgi:hypothetical protein
MEGCSEMVRNFYESFLVQNKLIDDIVKEYPETTEIMKKYFGEDCLKRTSFKIKTLEIACILFDVDPDRMIQEIEKVQN